MNGKKILWHDSLLLGALTFAPGPVFPEVPNPLLPDLQPPSQLRVIKLESAVRLIWAYDTGQYIFGER